MRLQVWWKAKSRTTPHWICDILYQRWGWKGSTYSIHLDFTSQSLGIWRSFLQQTEKKVVTRERLRSLWLNWRSRKPWWNIRNSRKTASAKKKRSQSRSQKEWNRKLCCRDYWNNLIVKTGCKSIAQIQKSKQEQIIWWIQLRRGNVSKAKQALFWQSGSNPRRCSGQDLRPAKAKWIQLKYNHER